MARTRTACVFILLILSHEVHTYRAKVNISWLEGASEPTAGEAGSEVVSVSNGADVLDQNGTHEGILEEIAGSYVSDRNYDALSGNYEEVNLTGSIDEDEITDPPIADARNDKFLVSGPGLHGTFGYQIVPGRLSDDDNDAFIKLNLWEECTEFDENTDECEYVMDPPIWSRKSHTMIIFADSRIQASKTEDEKPAISIDGGVFLGDDRMQRVTWILSPVVTRDFDAAAAERLEKFQGLITIAAMADSDIDQPSLTTCSFDPSGVDVADDPCMPRYLCKYSEIHGGPNSGTVCRPVVGDKPMADALNYYVGIIEGVLGFVSAKAEGKKCKDKCNSLWEKITGKIDLVENIINAFDPSDGPVVDDPDIAPEETTPFKPVNKTYPLLTIALASASDRLSEIKVKMARFVDNILKEHDGNLGDACKVNVDSFKYETLAKTIESLRGDMQNKSVDDASSETCAKLEQQLKDCDMLLTPLKPILKDCQDRENQLPVLNTAVIQLAANSSSQSLVQVAARSSAQSLVNMGFFEILATFGFIWMWTALAGVVVGALTYALVMTIAKFVVRQICYLIHERGVEKMTAEEIKARELCGQRGRRISQIVAFVLSTGAAIFIAGPFGFEAAYSLLKTGTDASLGHMLSQSMAAGVQGVHTAFEAGGAAYVGQIWLPFGRMAEAQLVGYTTAAAIGVVVGVPAYAIQKDRLAQRRLQLRERRLQRRAQIEQRERLYRATTRPRTRHTTKRQETSKVGRRTAEAGEAGA